MIRQKSLVVKKKITTPQSLMSIRNSKRVSGRRREKVTVKGRTKRKKEKERERE